MREVVADLDLTLDASHELFIGTWLQAAYDPGRTLPQVLCAFMQTLASRLPLAAARLSVDGLGAVVASRRGQAVEAHWRDGACALPLPPAGAVHAVPMRYGDQPLGELRLAWLPGAGEPALGLAQCRVAVRRCAHIVMRHEVCGLAQRQLGRPMLLVGCSEPLHQVELFVEKASRSRLPVLIRGEFGTEKVQLAWALHCAGPQRGGPFVEVHCADPAGQPAQWFEQARGGTLFFNGVDELAPALQSQLPRHLPSRLGQWLAAADAGGVRVVASTTADLEQASREGRFSRALAAELGFLAVTVPALRERVEDVEALVRWALACHGFDPQQKCSPALLDFCRRHAWTENLFELERVVARLAVMTDAQPIGAVDLLRHVPWLSGDGVVELAQPPQAPAANDVQAAPPRGMPAHAYWVHCIAARDAAALNRLHPALRKALSYLGDHHAEPLSLGRLAQQAHVSSSHLGYLFRSELGTSFKTLLLGIRVEKAKEILHGGKRQRITDIALAVGFTDLSHFQKCFKRLVGRTPGEFQREVA